MKLTDALKSWLVENCGVKADSSDDDFRSAAATAIASGTLSTDKFATLIADPKEATANQFVKTMETIVSRLDAIEERTKTPQTPPVAPPETPAPPQETDWHKGFMSQMNAGPAPTGDVRVKGAHEQYATEKSAAVYPMFTQKGVPHPLAGRPVMDFAEAGRQIDNPSELDKAVAGAYAKFCIQTARLKGSRSLAFSQMPQHEKDLLMYAMENMKWAGATDGGDRADIVNRNLRPSEAKALIDDATSGGLEAAPIVFDDMVIQAPLLTGELFPLVNVVPLDRGRRVEGVSVGKVTGSWGGIDDTAISLFNTSSYVSAFDTTIFRWQGAIKVGLDFMSDTPVDFGALITAQYGERLAEDLDDVIAAGNGTNQPEGIINKSGTTSVNFSGSTSIGNYESLWFGVSKAEHRPNVAASAVFCGNETSYQRARAIPVGASDARRIFGLDERTYSLFGVPYKINETLANTEAFYCIMSRYRMYRRRGLTFRTSTEGDTLIRANEMLITCTARYGGQLERGAAAAITTTAAS